MGRTFTVNNACSSTIWCLFTDPSAVTATPSQGTVWAVPAFSSISFFVPDNLSSGRIWVSASAPVAAYWLLASYTNGSRDRDFSTNPNSCLDGGCNGGLLCDAQTGTRVPPATVAEFTLSADPTGTTLAVSLVDGYNLPMRVQVDNDQGCGVPLTPARTVSLPTISHDFSLNSSNYPAPLQGPYGPTGFTLGCKSARAASRPTRTNFPNCCTGSYNTAATCPSSGVQYFSYFSEIKSPKYVRVCVYAYDESSSTALFSCPSLGPSSNQADYTVVFCP
ncbi:Osmotin thaumatin-like protein [Lactarius sanguifluus]|nr:Osmotin thaumatin-like protein [Lactarius sanguifluus]